LQPTRGADLLEGTVKPRELFFFLFCLCLGVVSTQAQSMTQPRVPEFDAYNSWKMALGTNRATDPATFTLLPGFNAQLLRSAQPGDGSWVSMAFDPQGRLTLAREARGLIRLTLQSDTVEKVEVIEDTLLECRGLLYANDSLYVNANNSKGFYRLRDNDGDGKYEDVKLLLRTGGNVGHGRNHVVSGPDGSIYLVHGNNVAITEKVAPHSPLQNYQNDSLIPCPFDNSLFDGDVNLPAGHILRTDADGKSFELIAGGFRNPLDIAFNRDGEMFTFDADMEWDVGSPWYRPNRVNHVIPGADFGWRRGTSKWPDYLPDTLPSTLDIGLASPTGIEFGTRSHFPQRYADALYIADWAYGRILAVHLTPRGATYTASSELFMSGRPMNVTDLTFGPDGAMYVITGGRGTQSGLYRVAYTGPKPTPIAKTRAEQLQQGEAAKARALRHQLEALQALTNGVRSDSALKMLWPHLGDPDPYIRHAARVALEHQDLKRWLSLALREKEHAIGLTAWLALAQTGNRELQEPLLQKLNQLPWQKLDDSQRLQALRTYELAFARMGKPGPELLQTVREKLEPLYPAADWHLNHRLCVLLVYVESPMIISKTLALIANSQRPEDLVQYLFNLRYVRQGWSVPQRAAVFHELDRADQQQGARDYYAVLKRIRDDYTKSLSDAERRELEPLLSPVRALTKLNTNLPPGQILRDWKLEDFNFNLPRAARSPQRGKSAFAKAQCVLCHRLGNEGGLIGPDLSAVGSRFDSRALLESIIEPSKVIDEKFRNTVFTLKDGTSLVGTIEREDERKVFLRESPFADKATELSRQQIQRREPSPISPMPAGLINILNKEEIEDLLGLLSAGVRPN
jgi:putative heme-binding domain-containing protein